MNLGRRDFLKRMAALGLVAAAAPYIFDYGANSYKQKSWVWHPSNVPTPQDPFMRCGDYYKDGKWVTGVAGEPDYILDERLANRGPGTYHWYEISRPSGIEIYSSYPKIPVTVRNYEVETYQLKHVVEL